MIKSLIFDKDSGIDCANCYFNNEMISNSNNQIYEWNINKISFFKQEIKVKVFDKAGNFNVDNINIWKFL